MISTMTQTTTTPNRLSTVVSVMENTLARVRALNSALTPASAPKTRAMFYARKNGGGYRTARVTCKCEQFGCYAPIQPGEVYFDTRETTQWPMAKKLCEQCAEGAI